MLMMMMTMMISKGDLSYAPFSVTVVARQAARGGLLCT
jgi:hypothetical protein